MASYLHATNTLRCAVHGDVQVALYAMHDNGLPRCGRRCALSFHPCTSCSTGACMYLLPPVTSNLLQQSGCKTYMILWYARSSTCKLRAAPAVLLTAGASSPRQRVNLVRSALVALGGPFGNVEVAATPGHGVPSHEQVADAAPADLRGIKPPTWDEAPFWSQTRRQRSTETAQRHMKHRTTSKN